MICPQCKQRNPINNKFCRECGSALPVSKDTLAAEEAARLERERTAEKVAQFLADAFALSEKGKVDEAILLAEESARLLPESTSAHSLLATLYERTEQEKKAIAAMERVVELNPQSAADRLKLEQLRRGVHVLPKRESQPAIETTPRVAWFPAMVALSISVSILALGLSLVRGQDKKVASTSAKPTTVSENLPASLKSAEKNNESDSQTPANAPASGEPSESPSPSAAPVASGVSPLVPSLSTVAPPIATSPLQRPRVAQAQRSRPLVGGSSPLLPPLKKGKSSGTPLTTLPVDAAPAPSAPISDGNSRNDSGDETTAPPAVTQPIAPEKPRGYIRIQVNPTKSYVPPPDSGETKPADPPSSSNEADPLQKAETLQNSGRYREAVGAYRQALSGGNKAAADGDAQQGIALSQQRLGNTAAARAAYRRAIHAYQTQIATGHNIRMAQRGIESCRAALEVLGG